MSDMSEATQAGERLRRIRVGGERGKVVYGFAKTADDRIDDGDCEHIEILRRKDESRLADEYLRLTDPTLIDEAWLRSIGFKDFAGEMIVIRNSEDDCVAFTLPNCRYPFVQGRGVYGTKTRGQLRCLLMGLNIPLPRADGRDCSRESQTEAAFVW